MTGLLLALSLARPAAAVQNTPLEPVLIELHLGRIAARTVPAYRMGAVALIPILQLFELAEIRTQPVEGDGLIAILQPGNVRLLVRPRERRLEVGRTGQDLSGDEVVVRDGEIYLSTVVLAKVMNADWEVRWDELAVTLVDPSALPLARRLVRESMAAARLAPGAERHADRFYPVERRSWGGAVMDYSVLAPSRNLLDEGAYTIGMGLDVLGGSFAANVQSEGSPRSGRVRSDVSWTGVWRDSRLLTVARAGDGISTGPRFRTLRGLSLTNAPYPRPTILGDLPYTAFLGPGWQFEAFRGGRLIAFDSVNALGQFSIDVPIQYGENPVDFVAYGPFGEIRQFNLTYRANPDVVPYRSLEYGISAGACRTDRCTATANVDVRYGLSRRWSVGVGVDQFWRQGEQNLFHPYVDATGSLGNAVSVQLSAVANALMRGQARFEPTVDVLFTIEGSHFAQEVDDPLLTAPGRKDQLTVTGFFRPISRIGSLFLTTSLDRLWTDAGTLTSARLGGSLQRNEMRLLPAVRFEESRVGTARSHELFYSVNGVVLPIRRLGAFLGQVSARTALEARSDFSPVSGSVFLSRPITRGLRTEIGAAWLPQVRGATLSAFLSLELASARATSLVTREPGGGVTLGSFAQGSLLLDREHRDIAFTVGPAVQRAGITGRVFMDLNDNGRYESEEPVVPGARILVGISSALSDSRGVYQVWDVSPYETATVAVDTTSLESPLWVPAWDAIAIDPNPNRFRTVDVPLLPGGVIEGQVVRSTAAGDLPAAAVQLVLRHLQTGKTRILTTFADGAFYAMGIRPGNYELQLGDRPAGGGGEAVALRFTLPASLEGASIGDLRLTIR